MYKKKIFHPQNEFQLIMFFVHSKNLKNYSTHVEKKN